MTTIGDDFPKQQERVRTILGYYKEIGPAGAFGAAMIELALKEAELAIASGDIVRILAAYKELQSIEE